MGFFNAPFGPSIGANYPYTDLHNLNLDWIVGEVKKCIEAVEPPDLGPLEQRVRQNEIRNDEQDIKLERLHIDDERLKASLLRAISDAVVSANEYTDEQLARFPDLHTVYVVSPVSGNTVPVQVALDELYDAMRYYGITAAQYDLLELPANTYDAKQLTAFDYDMMAAKLLP